MTTRFKRTGKNAIHGHRGVAHQNQFAFKHNPNSSTTKKILAIPNFGLCSKCHDIIEWRKRYRKYKPLKEAKKCTSCAQKKVLFAYHTVCQDCSSEKKVCPKCLEMKELTKREELSGGSEDIEERILRGMKERDRRALKRMVDRGEITLEEVQGISSRKTTADQNLLQEEENHTEDENEEEEEGENYEHEEEENIEEEERSIGD